MRICLIMVVLVLMTSPVQGRALKERPALELSEAQLEWVGHQVFRNECNLREACLVHWNRGEAFPSLGIGHFIWYPEGKSGPFVESFPSLVNYMQAQGAELADWLVDQAPQGAPWPDRDHFLKAEQGDDPRIHQLRTLLASEQGLQAAFLLERAQAALTDVVSASRNPGSTRRKVDALITTPGGVYALIDYVNFKGEGLAESERYQGVGWGLLQVLDNMPDVSSLAPERVLEEFRGGAARVLTRRAELADRDIEREQWLRGWLSRVDSYREPAQNN